MNAIAAVERVETFVKVAAGRVLVRTLYDLMRAVIEQVDEVLDVKGELSLEGDCWHGDVGMVDMGACQTSTLGVWEEAIREAASGELVIDTDGSRDCDGISKNILAS